MAGQYPFAGVSIWSARVTPGRHTAPVKVGKKLWYEIVGGCGDYRNDVALPISARWTLPPTPLRVGRAVRGLPVRRTGLRATSWSGGKLVDPYRRAVARVVMDKRLVGQVREGYSPTVSAKTVSPGNNDHDFLFARTLTWAVVLSVEARSRCSQAVIVLAQATRSRPAVARLTLLPACIACSATASAIRTFGYRPAHGRHPHPRGRRSTTSAPTSRSRDAIWLGQRGLPHVQRGRGLADRAVVDHCDDAFRCPQGDHGRMTRAPTDGEEGIRTANRVN
ncbi:hypothetical protein ACVWWN_003221 [Mycobacterium sp. URHB0021]|jgi:hypothetical protein